MFRIRIAGITVEIDNRHNYVYEQCEDYLCDDCAPAFRVAVSTADMEGYRASCGRPITLPEAESYLIYRRICEKMPAFGVYLLHAAVVEMDGRGYAFSAKRGTGKSTHTELWQNHFKGRATVINGDKPLIRRAPDGRFWAYGTPWCGKEGMGCNASVPLKALFLLERSTVPSCEPANQEYSVDRLFHQLLMPEKPEQMMKLLDMADKLVETVPCYRLRCDMTDDSVIAAYTVSNIQR